MRIALLATLLAATTVQAHVVLDRKTADANSYYKATFMVGHGCTGGLATRAVTVTIPESIAQVKPSPKPGWTIETRRVPLDKPYESYGQKVADRIAEVTWRGGPLAFDHYDEFVMLLRLPATAGKMYFPVKQSCDGAEMSWAEIPAAGKTRRDYKMPAAELEIVEPAKVSEPAHRH